MCYVLQVETPAPPRRSRWPALTLAAAIVLLPASIGLWLARGPVRARTPAAEELQSLDVLPFADAGAERNLAYLCGGVATDIRDNLSQVPGLRVTALASSARSLLEGELRKDHEGLQLKVRLKNTADGSTIWSKDYDRPLEEIFAVQDEVAQAVIAALQLKPPPVNAVVVPRYSRQWSVYEIYLRGLSLAARESIPVFEEALRQQPSYAPAYAAMAAAYAAIASEAPTPPREVTDKARQAATRALRLDEGMCDAHATLAKILMLQDWNGLAAAKELRRALALNPNFAAARRAYADYLLRAGKFRDAEAELRKAMTLDPLNPGQTRSFVELFYFSRQYVRLREYCREKAFDGCRYFLGRASLDEGKPEEAVALLARSNSGALAAAYARAGRRQEAEAIVRQAQVPPAGLAHASLALGNSERAWDFLRKGYELRDPAMTLLAVDPAFDTIRDDKRFSNLLGRW